MSNYRYLTFKDRQTIERMHKEGVRSLDIATALKVHTPTIYIELKKGRTGQPNENGQYEYSAEVAEAQTQKNLKSKGNHSKKPRPELEQPEL